MLTASVGKDSRNLFPDVMLVQKLLNDRPPHLLSPLVNDGVCGPKTLAAITLFQTQIIRMPVSDGKIDPNGPTIRALSPIGTNKPPHKHLAVDPKVKQKASIPNEIIIASQLAQTAWNVPASISIAQWALESTWGRDMPMGSNNPFGIKAGRGQSFVPAMTYEYGSHGYYQIQAHFRSFASIAEAFDQHAKLLATFPPYAKAMMNATNPDRFADMLTGVYATDPSYGSKLKKIMTAHNLYQYNTLK